MDFGFSLEHLQSLMGSRNGFQVFTSSLQWEVGMDSGFSMTQSPMGCRSGFGFSLSLLQEVGMDSWFSLAVSNGN